MNIALPESLETRLTPQDVKLHLAIGLFASEKATLAQAADLAGMSQLEFTRELGHRKIPTHYGLAEFSRDLEVIEGLRSAEKS